MPSCGSWPDLLDGVELVRQVDLHLGVGPPRHLDHHVEDVGLAALGPEQKVKVMLYE